MDQDQTEYQTDEFRPLPGGRFHVRIDGRLFMLSTPRNKDLRDVADGYRDIIAKQAALIEDAVSAATEAQQLGKEGTTEPPQELMDRATGLADTQAVLEVATAELFHTVMTTTYRGQLDVPKPDDLPAWTSNITRIGEVLSHWRNHPQAPGPR